MKDKIVDVYDFDHTIYNGDASIDFIIYSMTRDPSLLRYLPGSVIAVLTYMFGTKSRKEVKERVFRFLNSIEDLDSVVNSFWSKHEHKIGKWYLDSKKSSDIIISASPEFILKPIMDKIGVILIATNMNTSNGRIYGENCRAEEKVRRLKKYDKTILINKFYSDSLSDMPLFNIAEHPFIVKGSKISSLYDYEPSYFSRLKTPEFIRFLFVGSVSALLGVSFAFMSSLFLSNPLIAWIVGYLLSLIPSYLLNSFITFKYYNLSLKKFVSFIISYVPNFSIQLICVQFLANYLGIYPLFAYVLSVIVALPLTFILLATRTFIKKKDNLE